MVVSLLERGAKLGLPPAIVLDRDVDRLLAENAGTLQPGGRWGTLIIRAAEQAPAQVIETLIRHGASVDVVDTEDDIRRRNHGLHAVACGRVSRKHRCGAGAARARRERHGARHEVLRHSGGLGELRASRADSRHDPAGSDRLLRRDLVRSRRSTARIFDREPGDAQRADGSSACCESLTPNEWTKSWWTPLAFAVVNNTRRRSRATRARRGHDECAIPRGGRCARSRAMQGQE